MLVRYYQRKGKFGYSNLQNNDGLKPEEVGTN